MRFLLQILSFGLYKRLSNLSQGSQKLYKHICILCPQTPETPSPFR